MQTSLRGIATKAKQNKDYKFGNLYGLLNKDALYQAWKDINKKSATGIDRETAREFVKNLDGNLELRIKDNALLRLIKKWLKAGILDTDGKVINPITGCPQGSTVSPILANIYLHYALDLWFEKIVKPACIGDVYICRLADDFICAFRYKVDAEKFYNVLGKRLGKFKLELAEEKTKIISFSRFRKYENTSFEFLGFEFRWAVSNKGKDVIRRRTSRSKLRKSIKAFSLWCKENRNKRIKNIVETLNSKYRGYFNYYGVIGNSKGIGEFYSLTLKILYKWLNRRSQRKSFNWKEFNEKMKWYGLAKPKVVEKADNQIRFEECFA